MADATGRELELLLARGYRAATFYEAVTSTPSVPTMAITFDDAFASVRELAFPILSAFGLVATVFVVTDYADGRRKIDFLSTDTHGVDESEVRALSWAELDELARAGWEIGSHTRTHPRLTRLDDGTLAAELHESRAACEHALGRPCRSLAYPFGDVDARVVTAVRAAGYETAAGLPTGVGNVAPLLWPRTGVYRKDSLRRFRLKISPTMHRVRKALVRVEKRVRA
jgi:peptidoglycan/xylan/chitin deacetylase (PgdA/CDA1 family)